MFSVRRVICFLHTAIPKSLAVGKTHKRKKTFLCSLKPLNVRRVYKLSMERCQLPDFCSVIKRHTCIYRKKQRHWPSHTRWINYNNKNEAIHISIDIVNEHEGKKERADYPSKYSEFEYRRKMQYHSCVRHIIPFTFFRLS